MDAVMKFNTCAYRSSTKIAVVVRTCCSSKKVMKYKCYLRNIEGVTPAMCEKCPMYKEQK